MRRSCLYRLLLLIACVAALSGNGAPGQKQISNGRLLRMVTQGWLVEEPWPDQDDPSQAWRKIAGTLILARSSWHAHPGTPWKGLTEGQGRPGFRSWTFWNNGREVVVEDGPPYGQSTFLRISLRSGRRLQSWAEQESLTDEPDWVRAAENAS